MSDAYRRKMKFLRDAGENRTEVESAVGDVQSNDRVRGTKMLAVQGESFARE